VDRDHRGVVLALASAVTLLFYPLVRLIQEMGGARNSAESYYAIVGSPGWSSSSASTSCSSSTS
jgi:hypothetical protein